MRHYAQHLTVPYSTNEMYNLAADVERYPEFLDGWRAVRILRTDGNVRTVEQVLGVGPLKWRFRSYATADPPRHLQIRSTEVPFRLLQIDWRLADRAGGGAEVEFEAECALRSDRLDRLAADLLEALFARTVGAFERRAQHLFVPRPASTGDPS